MAKSLKLTYIFWAMCGIFGIHHLYLGRYLHWFLWITSCGGFGVGLLIDLFKIPSFVRERNLTASWMARWASQGGRKVWLSEWQLDRWVGALLFSLYYEVILYYAVDEVIDSRLVHSAMRTCGRTLGVYLCSSLGRKCCSITTTALVSTLCELCLPFIFGPMITGPRSFPSPPITPQPSGFSSIVAAFITTIAAFSTQRYKSILPSASTSPPQSTRGHHHAHHLHLNHSDDIVQAEADAIQRRKRQPLYRRALHHLLFIGGILVSLVLFLICISSAVWHHTEVPNREKPSERVLLREVISEAIGENDVEWLMKENLMNWAKRGEEKGLIGMGVRMESLIQMTSDSFGSIFSKKVGGVYKDYLPLDVESVSENVTDVEVVLEQQQQHTGNDEL